MIDTVLTRDNIMKLSKYED